MPRVRETATQLINFPIMNEYPAIKDGNFPRTFFKKIGQAFDNIENTKITQN